jgi:hypothetical protein
MNLVIFEKSIIYISRCIAGISHIDLDLDFLFLSCLFIIFFRVAAPLVVKLTIDGRVIKDAKPVPEDTSLLKVTYYRRLTEGNFTLADLGLAARIAVHNWRKAEWGGITEAWNTDLWFLKKMIENVPEVTVDLIEAIGETIAEINRRLFK